MQKTIPIFRAERSCAGCTGCCDGWLKGSAHGYDFWPGRPCHFVTETGCSIYENRPENPCKSYNCLWRTNTSVPEWMKPSECGVVLTEKTIDGIPYIEATELGIKMDSSVLTWIFTKYADDTFKNIKFQVGGGWNWMGSREFVDAISKL